MDEVMTPDERLIYEKGRAVLDVPMQPNDADAKTIRDYLVALLTKLWEHGEVFSAEKPFGSSAWEFDLFEGLVHAGLISGVIEDGNYLSEFDREAGKELIGLAIKALGHERASIVESLLREAAGIRKNGEGLGEPQFHWLAAERTEMIADQIRRGVL